MRCIVLYCMCKKEKYVVEIEKKEPRIRNSNIALNEKTFYRERLIHQLTDKVEFSNKMKSLRNVFSLNALLFIFVSKEKLPTLSPV